jgi:HprK-related kinase A
MNAVAPVALRDIAPHEIDGQGRGLVLDFGACTAQVKSRSSHLWRAIHAVYGAFPVAGGSCTFTDFHVRLSPGCGARRVWRPQARFLVDGLEPFDPFPHTHAFPMFEWGVNWCFAQRAWQYVLLHAGVLARGSRAVVMPAVPGSGKSTLSAALTLSGYRLLSDEFGVLDPESGLLKPMLKPIALKNHSISVIRSFSAAASLGPTFPGTRKGDVAHFPPDSGSVAARHEGARPAIVLFPKYITGAALDVRPMAPEVTFARLAFNSFNYGNLGELAFDAVADLVEKTKAYQIRYGRLEDAVAWIDVMFDSMPAEA